MNRGYARTPSADDDKPVTGDAGPGSGVGDDRVEGASAPDVFADHGRPGVGTGLRRNGELGRRETLRGRAFHP